MSSPCVRRNAAFLMILFACLRAGAQEVQTIEVKGTVHSDEPFLYGYVVELTGLASRTDTFRTDIHTDGSFDLRGVPPGDYMLRIRGARGGGTVTEELVSVYAHPATLDINLPRAERPGPPETISVRQLQHPPSPKALEAAASAQKFVESGKNEKALEQLRKAIRLSPDFAAAHSNLGALYIRMGDSAAARPEIEQSLAIAGPNAIDLTNLAFVDACDRRLREAVEHARAALRADPSNTHAHYVLGALLVLDRRTAAEGIRHLQRAAEEIPSARAALERACGAAGPDVCGAQ